VRIRAPAAAAHPRVLRAKTRFMTWTASILSEPPVSGSVSERVFDSRVPGGSWLWVSFRDLVNGESWAASFRRRFDAPDAVHLVFATDDAVVIAGAEAYWISLAEQTMRYHEPNVFQAVPIPTRAMVAASDFTTVSLLAPEGVAWRSPRISLDGLSFTEVTADVVKGEAEDSSGHVPFEVELGSRVVRGGMRSWQGAK